MQTENAWSIGLVDLAECTLGRSTLPADAPSYNFLVLLFLRLAHSPHESLAEVESIELPENEGIRSIIQVNPSRIAATCPGPGFMHGSVQLLDNKNNI